jgi:probable F420-dependent oxidoreductase
MQFITTTIPTPILIKTWVTVTRVKVRIGFGVSGVAPLDHDDFVTVVDGLEATGFDSLWLSERIGAASFDPVTALSFAAGRTKRIKFGTSVSVLPGRNPADLAKQWATLALLSNNRALPAFGLGVVHPNEQQAFGVQRGERAARFDEMLPLLRRIWTEPTIDHDGHFFQYHDLRVEPKPPKPLDVWLGGKAPIELRRVGRLGDGWLASFAMPEQCGTSRTIIEAAAAEAGRSIDPEHYGAMLFYSHGPLHESVAALIANRNPGTDPSLLVPSGWHAVRERIQEYIAVGFSKIVLVPFAAIDNWQDELRSGSDALLDMQT